MKLKVDDILVNTTEGGEGIGILLIIIDMTERSVAVLNPNAPLQPLIWYPKPVLLARVHTGQLKLVTDEKVEGFN